MTVKILPPSGGGAGKLADAELYFDDGTVLAGHKLVGFSVWSRHDGSYNVTFPARQYTVGGEKRTYALLRPVLNPNVQNNVKQLIIDAFQAWQTGGDASPAMAKAKAMKLPDPWA